MSPASQKQKAHTVADRILFEPRFELEKIQNIELADGRPQLPAFPLKIPSPRHLTGWPIDRLAECATHNPLKLIIRKAVRMFGEMGNALAISDSTESQHAR